jgi:3-oxoadipate enol-lactonase
MPYVRVNDIQMYYELRGDGEPLALIVGLGTDISEWDVIIRWLTNKYQVLAFDNRGAGRTDKPDIPLQKSVIIRTITHARANAFSVET